MARVVCVTLEERRSIYGADPPLPPTPPPTYYIGAHITYLNTKNPLVPLGGEAQYRPTCW